MALILPTLDSEKLGDALRTLRRWRELIQGALRLPPASDRGVIVVATVAAGTSAIDHGLGAKPSGWLVVRVQGAAGCALAEVSSDDKTLTLHATASATLTLWVWP